MQGYSLNAREERKFASLSRNTLPHRLEINVQRPKSIKNNNPGISITYHHQEPPRRVYSNYIMKGTNENKYEPIYISNAEQSSNLIKQRKSFAPKRIEFEQQFNIPRKSIQIHSHHKRQSSQYPQPALLNKKSESEVEKLTKICEQFYHENQKLKIKLLQSDGTQIQQLNRRIMELDSELNKSKKIIQNRNRQITQMGGKLNVIDLSDKPNSYHRPSFHKLNTQNNSDCKIDKLTLELRNKQQELMKYMQKQSQYIQVYVQKQQLQHQIRNLVAIIESQNKQLDQNKRVRINDQIYDQCNQCQNNKEGMKKMTQFNEKLTGMLNISSSQIQRLNNLLKIKVDVIQNNRNIIMQLKNQLNKQKLLAQISIQNNNEIHTFKAIEEKKQNSPKVNILMQNQYQLQKEIKQLKEDVLLKNQKLNEYQLNIETLNRENKNLQHRLNDQVGVSYQLRDFITKLQNQLKQYHKTQKKEGQTIKEILNSNQQQSEAKKQIQKRQKVYQTELQIEQIKNQKKNQKEQWNQKLEQTKNALKEQENIYEASLIEMQKRILKYQEQLNSLAEQNQELTKFVMRQNDQIVKLKDEISSLKLRQTHLQKTVQKLSTHQKQIPILINRVSQAQTKLIMATKSYEKLLFQVQSSRSETQSVHKQLEQMIEEKHNSLGIDNFKIAPMSTRSEAGHQPNRIMKKNRKNQGNGLDISQAKSNQNKIYFEQQWESPKLKDQQQTFYSRHQINEPKNNY